MKSTLMESRKDWFSLLKIFKHSLVKPYLDHISLSTGRFRIDIIQFDDNLKAEYADEYPEGMSIKEFITFKFGENASNLIERLL